MASSGKKGKKTKGKTLALNDFLHATPGTTPTIPIRKSNINWADEVEDNYDQYESSRPKANVVLPTAPKSARGFDEFNERVPQHPPYIAYISNLPYDVREEEIAEFFGELKIANMKIPKDDRSTEVPRLKGHGYIEFEDRDSLIGALSISDSSLKNRRIKIDVADNTDNDRRRGGRMDNNRDRPDRSNETSGDWRSRPRTEPPEPERNRGGFNRDGFNRDRDRERDSTTNERSWRDSSDRPSLRDSDKARDGFGDRNRFNDGEKRGFGPRRERDDRGFTRGNNREEPDKFEPKTRPKLVLARRTIPLEGEQNPPEAEVSTTSMPPAANQSSIFGAAKPVDTSARERAIEDRLAKLSEKTSTEGGNRRDTDRRDRGRRDDDSRWGRDRKRDSPIRRGSPEHRNNYSPPRNKDFDRRSSSPERRYSPERRRRSPNYRRNSRDRRRSPEYSPDSRRSPEYRRDSPGRKRSPDYRRRSPDLSPRRSSPEYRRSSPDARRDDEQIQRRSPERRRSPEYRRSPTRRGSPETRGSPELRKSPDRKRSPDARRDSLENKRKSPDRAQSARSNQRRNDDRDKKGPTKPDKPKIDKEKPRKEEKSHKENHEKEMPKLKEPETPNFAAFNKYAFLDGEENLE